MKKFSIANLAWIIKARHAIRNTQYAMRAFTGVSIDSRTTRAGDCFFAVPGENYDGHDYVADAFASGAVCAVVSKHVPADNGSKILRVDDTVKALGQLAAHYRRQCSFKVIAITGSVGKTMTRQITYHILSQRFRVSQSPKNFNNDIGLPLSLLAADADDEIVIVELGTNHPGEISYLTRIARPDIAVVTNVYPAHLTGFGNVEAIFEEKLSISEGLQNDGVLIVNGNFDRLVDACRAKGITFVTFGNSSYHQVRDIDSAGLTSSFTINGTDINLPLPGPGNVENALAAFAVCCRFEISVDEFARALSTVPTVPMRAELLQIGTLTVLNDCYNANPASMRNALDILANFDLAENQRRVFICGDMAELGDQTRELHAQLGNSVVQAKVRLLLTVGRFAKITAEAAKTSAEYDLQTKCFADTLSACNNLQEFIKDYDIILVKGSRSNRLESAVEKLKEFFSRTTRSKQRAAK